jgi:peptide deformylase
LAIQPIRLLPDPVLRTRTRRVRGIDASLQRLIDEMVETMRDAHGVGLAANQIGVSLRLCVIEIPEEEEVRVLINPEIIARRGEREIEEGCLSIPGYRGLVHRSQEVRVRALDREGQPVRIKAEDNLLAQALEHEIGHLNGQLYIDHLVRKDAIWKLGEEETDEEQSSPDPNPSPARTDSRLPASS